MPLPSWLEQANEQLNCIGSGSLSSTAIKNIIIYKRLEKLLLACPDILDSGSESYKSLAYAMEQIACGNLYEEFGLLQFEAILAIAELECATQIEEDTDPVIAAGIHASPGTATTQDITLPGVVATDVVNATLRVRAGSEAIVTAITAVDKVTLVFSAAPTTATRVNYTVVRP